MGRVMERDSDRERERKRERSFNGSGFSGLNFDDVHNALKSFLIGPAVHAGTFGALMG